MTYKQLGGHFCSELVIMGKRTLILTRRVNYVDYKVEGRRGEGKREKFTALFYIYPSSLFLMWETKKSVRECRKSVLYPEQLTYSITA